MKNRIALITVLLFAITAYSAGPLMQKQREGPVKVSPPGLPVVGMLQQHMHSDGIGAFVQVDRIWNDTGDLVRYYFNSNRVDRTRIDDCAITVWFLEEYTPQSRELYKLGDLTYRYYELTLYYCDPWGNGYPSPFEYEWSSGYGETCDLNYKNLALIDPSKQINKLTDDNMPWIKLGHELKDRYDLK